MSWKLVPCQDQLPWPQGDSWVQTPSHRCCALTAVKLQPQVSLPDFESSGWDTMVCCIFHLRTRPDRQMHMSSVKFGLVLSDMWPLDEVLKQSFLSWSRCADQHCNADLLCPSVSLTSPLYLGGPWAFRLQLVWLETRVPSGQDGMIIQLHATPTCNTDFIRVSSKQRFALGQLHSSSSYVCQNLSSQNKLWSLPACYGAEYQHWDLCCLGEFEVTIVPPCQDRAAGEKGAVLASSWSSCGVLLEALLCYRVEL